MVEDTKAAFVEAYDEHVWDVYGFLAYRLVSREDAEDLTQLTFERALRSWRSYDRSKASVKTWLLAIARNLLVDHHRRGRDREVLSPIDPKFEEGLGHAESPQEVSLGLSAELESALESLTARDHEVLALRYGADLTGPEIATLTGLSLANVQQIVSRALRTLRTQLEPDRSGGAVATDQPAASGPTPARPSPTTSRSARPEPE